MGKREDEREAQHQAWCREVERLGWARTEAFEKDLNAPDTDYRLGVYRAILHRTIMHYARKGLVRDDYERDYAPTPVFLDKAVDLIARQTKLALAAHKIEWETAKLERQVSADAHKRHRARPARETWDQPHASHHASLPESYFEPGKHLKPGERSAADVPFPALQGADEDDEALP
jgi:hypothetical protein